MRHLLSRVTPLWILVLGLPLLFAWQLSIFRTDLQPTHKVGLGGLHSQDRFAYFLYYKNLFPVVSMAGGRDQDFYFGRDEVRPEPNTLTYSREGADRLLAERGSSLLQEWGHTIRNENHLQTYLYLPDAWRRGSPQLAETRLTNAAVFMIALAAVFAAFVLVRRPWLGVGIVVLIGSNPFQLFSAYREENIKSWPITMFCVAAAVLAPLIAGVRLRWQVHAAIAAIIGLAFGTAFHIRTETAAALIGVLAIFLTVRELSWTARIAMMALVVTTFGGTLMSWSRFFDRKIAESTRVVAAAGGHVYPGPLQGTHPLWCSLWPGLGDFDRTHGYTTGDAAPIRYLEPILRDRFHEEMPWWWGMSREKQGRSAADYYDADQIYYRYPFDSPNTGLLLREKVVADIVGDPFWYAGILAKRVWRILSQLTPVQFYVAPRVVLRVPFHGLIAVLVLGVAWWRRDWTAIRLLTLSLPLSIVALVITSDANFPYFSIYHLCAAAIVLSWCAAWINSRWVRRDAIGPLSSTAQ